MHRPTYAELTSTLALFIALGGVSWAAATLPRNSVASATIRDGQVRSADLAQGAVSAAKLSKDLRSQLGVQAPKGGDGASGSAGASGADGRHGATGAAGPAGAPGAPGAPGRDGAAIVTMQNLGNHDVSSTSWTKAAQMTWSQPGGTLDEIRGLYTSTNGPTCGSGAGGAQYRLVVDGTEVSYDVGNEAPDGSSEANDPPARIIPAWANNHPKTDRGTFGAELPIVSAPGAATAEHTLELWFKRDSVCAGPVGLRDVTLYVTRFAQAT